MIMVLFVSVSLQDDLDSTTLDVGKLSEVPEITKVFSCFNNSIIVYIFLSLILGSVTANIHRRLIKFNFPTRDAYNKLYRGKMNIIQSA